MIANHVRVACTILEDAETYCYNSDTCTTKVNFYRDMSETLSRS